MENLPAQMNWRTTALPGQAGPLSRGSKDSSSLGPRFGAVRATRERTGEGMVFIEACPRCGGALQKHWDSYGNYSNCLQCGFHLEVGDDENVERLADDYPLLRATVMDLVGQDNTMARMQKNEDETPQKNSRVARLGKGKERKARESQRFGRDVRIGSRVNRMYDEEEDLYDEDLEDNDVEKDDFDEEES